MVVFDEQNTIPQKRKRLKKRGQFWRAFAPWKNFAIGIVEDLIAKLKTPILREVAETLWNALAVIFLDGDMTNNKAQLKEVLTGLIDKLKAITDKLDDDIKDA